MLYPEIDKSRKIEGISREGGSLVLKSEKYTHWVTPYSERCIRLCTTDGRRPADSGITTVIKMPYENWSYETDGDICTVSTGATVLKIDLMTASVSYYDGGGRLLLSEAPDESRDIERFMTQRILPESSRTERVMTADGEKTVIREAAKTDSGESFHTWLRLERRDGEELFGLGQHEEGYGSLCGRTVYVHQGNRKIALPLMVSNLGCGLLVDCESPIVFDDGPLGRVIRCEAAPQLSFYFLNGGDMSGAVAEYRKLTGKASMLPKWMFGYIQSQERYETADEIVAVAEEYRKRGVGLDCAVLDWMSWEGGKWGQKSFDPARFPDPSGMIKKLHENGVKFMISVWPSTADTAENRRDFAENGLMIPESDFYDPYKKEGRDIYWRQTSEGLFRHGVDAWWCDNCEPFTPEWEQRFRPLPGQLYNMYIEQAMTRLPAEKSNSYALYHAKGVYEGQRAECDEKRVVNLTRSGYTGHQRFGTVLWSGDIEAKWETLRHQIAAGLGLCASGHPYWTLDIGAFFVKRGTQWYWKGDYPDAERDPAYCELFTRWYQWAAFLPIFRGHGTDCRREIWNFGGVFFDAMKSANRLRYSLIPYIYSAAGGTWLRDGSMMRFLAFDYPNDPVALKITDQYMFGESMMVCPVTEPMYYAKGGKALQSDKTCRVYLPEGGWYRLGRDGLIPGGRWIDADADIAEIPVFVKAGSIIPTADPALSTSEQSDAITLNVYPGADGSFDFYDDSGDGYAYERGDYLAERILWNDADSRLTVPPRLKERVRETRVMKR